MLIILQISWGCPKSVNHQYKSQKNIEHLRQQNICHTDCSVWFQGACSSATVLSQKHLRLYFVPLSLVRRSTAQSVQYCTSSGRDFTYNAGSCQWKLRGWPDSDGILGQSWSVLGNEIHFWGAISYFDIILHFFIIKKEPFSSVYLWFSKNKKRTWNKKGERE